MSDVQIALVAAFLISLLIGSIEIVATSRTRLAACANALFFAYLALLSLGNSATTLLATRIVAPSALAAAEPPVHVPPNVVGQVAPAAVDPKPTAKQASLVAPLPGPLWFWCAFLGVFAFEALLVRLNVTLFDTGLFTLSDWIKKARDIAAAEAIKTQTSLDISKMQRTAARLTKIPSGILAAQVGQALGEPRVLEVQKSAATVNADLMLSLALAFAAAKPDDAEAAARANGV
jgi:hypothetical protein